jgi:hypothetical protein
MKFKATIILFLISLGFSFSSYADGFCEGPLSEENAIESAAGVITYQGNENAIGDCVFAPDGYQVTIYEMGLCTSDPTAPTTSSAYETDTCSTVINSPSGQTINLAAGSELTLTDVTRPTNGTYTHAYMVLGNSFGITVTKQFTNTMHRYDTATSGNFCWTTSGTKYNSDWGGPPANPTTFANCGTEGEAAPAMYTEILDDFDEDTYNYGPVSVESGNLTAYLVADSNDRLVNAVKTADRIFGKQTLGTAVEVTNTSSTFVVSFGVNQATSPHMSNEGSLNTYDVIAFGSGPFSAFITVE